MNNLLFRILKYLLLIIKCSNRNKENCDGEFVLNLYDTCYFMYDIKKDYGSLDSKYMCLEKNQTEVDLPTNFPDYVLLYFTFFQTTNLYKAIEKDFLFTHYFSNFFILIFFL